MKRVWLVLCAVVFGTTATADVDIKEVVSPSGLTAWLVEDHSIPFVALEVRFRGGTSLDSPDAHGAVNLMTGLLEEGTGDLDSRGFARATEALAASFDFDVSDDELSVSARFLSENRTDAVALLRRALVEPAFSQSALDRVRGQVLSGLRSDAKDPNEIASRTFRRMAYGDHPYATAREGTLESVAALTRDDIVAAHKAVLARDRVYIGAAGDITPDQLGALMDALLTDLPTEGAPMPGRADLQIDGGVTVVPFDTPQSVALFGQPGLKQEDPDFFAAILVNQVLGGGSFESRLMTEVREKRGLTYGVYSYLVPKDHAELYMGSVASANDRIADAIGVIADEWRLMAETGVTEDELRDAKTYLTGSYPLRFDGNARIAGIIVGMQMADMPIDYIATRNQRVEAVTLEDANRVAADLLSADGLRFVVVGQPAGLESAETTSN